MIHRILNRINSLNVDLQHLLVLTFPRDTSSYRLYLDLKNCGVFPNKLTTHSIYSKSIINYLDIPTNIIHYENGQIQYRAWYQNGVPHREGDLCAIEWYYINGQIAQQEWWINGNRHRETDDEPAFIEYRDNGKILHRAWYKYGICLSEVY